MKWKNNIDEGSDLFDSFDLIDEGRYFFRFNKRYRIK